MADGRLVLQGLLLLLLVGCSRLLSFCAQSTGQYVEYVDQSTESSLAWYPFGSVVYCSLDL